MNVAIIPARGGSSRIQRKNIRPFHGKPIIAYSIEAARASGLFKSIIVSTDDAQISSIALQHGAESYMRPSDDGVRGTQHVTAEVLREVSATWACCIYPCAPLINGLDLKEAYQIAYDMPYNYVYGVGQFYFGIARRFLDSPDDFSYSHRMESERYIDINTEEDWKLAEIKYARLHGIVGVGEDGLE